jgi:hypothetical protein
VVGLAIQEKNKTKKNKKKKARQRQHTHTTNQHHIHKKPDEQTKVRFLDRELLFVSSGDRIPIGRFELCINGVEYLQKQIAFLRMLFLLSKA